MTSAGIEMPLVAEPVLSTPGSDDEHGEVFTRRWVVDLILDLAGYDSSADLACKRVVEPACGEGAFIVPIIERLVGSARAHGRGHRDLFGAIRAFDIQAGHVEATRVAAVAALRRMEVPPGVANELADRWTSRADFLLTDAESIEADFVIGNPPYVRIESVPASRSGAYRQACQTMGGRADIYVGFYEVGLRALNPGGTLAFICADRWMRNAYGARLRDLVTATGNVDAIVSLTGVDVFETEVDAYPAITSITKETRRSGPLIVEAKPEFGPSDAEAVVEAARGLPSGRSFNRAAFSAAHIGSWPSGEAGWPSATPEQIAAIRTIESLFDSLENPQTGTRVGIGVATGADKIYLTTDSEIVEHDRLLPLAMPSDLSDGVVDWSGTFLVDPWQEDGLVDLEEWPATSAYFEQHRERLEKRHTAKSGKWFKTIDRVNHSLLGSEKLYIPDFKDELFPVLDTGTTYPHHNLYWITSRKWDLRVLGGILMSDVANLFLSAYSVRMRGGYLRFQAQYLRRIRVPDPRAIPRSTADRLANAFAERDRATASRLVLPLYGLDDFPG